jgi:maltose/moltooligosaccharide transporter
VAGAYRIRRSTARPTLTIAAMFGFGIVFSAVNPLFLYIGASEHDLPILNIAGPIAGLFIQPLIGAFSDKTWSDRWGRRKPFIYFGASWPRWC